MSISTGNLPDELLIERDSHLGDKLLVSDIQSVFR